MPINSTNTPVFLEDIIEWMCGDTWRTLWLEQQGQESIGACQVQLSQFDRSVCANISDSGLALTQKQVDLCVKMIKRYQKQIELQIPNIAELIDPVNLKQPVRKIDQTRAIWLEDDHIIVKFPFNQDIVNKMKKYSTSSTIRLGEYMPDDKLWKWIPCEHTYYTLGRILEKHDFDVDKQILNLISATLDLNPQHDTLYYEKELQTNNQYINKWLGTQKSETHMLLKLKSNGLKYNQETVAKLDKKYQQHWYQKLLSNYHKHSFWLNSHKISKHQIIDFIVEQNITLVIKFGLSGHKKELLKTWVDAFIKNKNIDNQDITFSYNGFESWSSGDMDFEKFLTHYTDGKDYFVKNSIKENTKIILMPFEANKEWLTSRVKPMLTIQIGQVHSHDNKSKYMLENTHALVYYSSDVPNNQDIVTIV